MTETVINNEDSFRVHLESATTEFERLSWRIMKWVVWFYNDKWWRWMKSEKHTELQTLRTRQTTAISCQLKRLWRRSTLIQCRWKWVQRLLKDCKWLSSEVFEQVKLEIDSTRINRSNCSNENIARWRREVMLWACISVTSD